MTSSSWRPRFDKCFGVIVRARDEASARALASSAAGSEGEKVWKDPKETSCKRLEVEGEVEIVMLDFVQA